MEENCEWGQILEEREGNRVCRKDEESTKRGKGSIEKSTEGDKVTSRPRKEKNRSMESRGKSNAEYKGFSVQEKTGKEISGLIYQSIYY